jgi:hypothetical protein
MTANEKRMIEYELNEIKGYLELLEGRIVPDFRNIVIGRGGALHRVKTIKRLLDDQLVVSTLLDGLKDVLDQVDDAREDLHDLCQISDAHILADLYHELTTVADKIYRLAYQKERN